MPFKETNFIPLAIVKLLIAEGLQKHNKGKINLSDETLQQLCGILNAGENNTQVILTKRS